MKSEIHIAVVSNKSGRDLRRNGRTNSEIIQGFKKKFLKIKEELILKQELLTNQSHRQQ